MAEIKDLQQDVQKGNFKALLIENIKYKTLLTKKYQERKPYTPKDIKKITAFIPGIITKIFIKPNKKVKEGEKLLVLEAMKMSNDIISPIAGTIKNVFVAEGERVNKEKILIEFK
jgi:biotin carboxyl carrier protein